MATEKTEYKNVFAITPAPQPATDPEEFKRFHELITKGRPDYSPWLIPLGKGEVVLKDKKTKISGKDPSLYGGWKDEKNRLTFEQAYKRLQNGFNVGVAATDKDPYVILDVDDMGLVGDTKPTLQAISRKRLGRHNYYITEEQARGEDNPYDTTAKDNIPLDVAGELRSCWQYVVAPGSFVPCGPEEYNSIPEEDKHNAGKYSLLNPIDPTSITFNELPEIFKAKRIADIRNAIEHDLKNAQKQNLEPGDNHSKSGIFELSAGDVLGYTHRDFEKFSSPLHGSSTGANASFTGPLLHCWRHNVSHSGYSLLAVQAGLYECGEAGTPHKKAGCSYLKYGGEEIFKVWEYAKREGIIPTEDPIPSKALVYFAVSSGICKETDIIDGWKLPTLAYNRALSAILEGGINPGRAPIGEVQEDDDTGTPNKLSFFSGKNFNVRKLGEYVLSLVKCKTLENTGEVLYYENGVYRRGGERIISRIVQNVLGDRSRKNRQSEVINWIKNETYVKAEQFNPENMINLKNGVFDRVTWQLLPHTPDLMFTMQHPVNYDPKAKCGKIERFISEILETDKAQTVYEFLGYSLTPQMDIQKAVIIYGPPRAGKSTFLKVCTELLGTDNISSESLQSLENDRFAVANLRDKCLNIFSDLPNVPLSDIPIFKQIVGGDRLRGEEKYLPAFTFKPTVKLLFSANTLPPIKSLDGAKSRRLILIRVNGTVPTEKCNSNLDKELKTPEELSGLLNLALDGLKRLLENGHYTYETSTEDTQIEYLAHSDPVKAFAQQCIVYSATEHIVKKNMLESFVEWCDYYGVEKLTGHRLTKGLKFLGMDENRETTGDREQYWEECNFSDWCMDKLKSVKNVKKCDEKNQEQKNPPSDIKKSVTGENQDQGNPPSHLLPNSLKTNEIESKEDNGIIDGHSVEVIEKVIEVFGENGNKCDGLAKNDSSGDSITPSYFKISVTDKTGKQEQAPQKTAVKDSAKFEKSVTDLIEDCLDKWEAHHGRIFAGNKVRVPFDISRYTDANGIDSKLIFDAVEKRSKHRCLDCGVDTHLNEEIGKGYRCKSCHDIYSNPPPVVIPEEISLEPKEDSPCTHPAHTVVINVTKTTWASVKDLPADCVYIGRNNNRWKIKDKVRYNFKKSKWHNKYIEDDLKNGKKRDGTREEVIEKFRKDTLQNDELLEDLPELFGKSFVCWHPGPCHGDILLEFRDISFSGYSVVGRCITANEFRSLYSATQEAGRELSSDEIMQILSRSDVRMPAENNPEPVEVTT